MPHKENNFKTFVVGVMFGIGCAVAGATFQWYTSTHPEWKGAIKGRLMALTDVRLFTQKKIIESFDEPIAAVTGTSFGRQNQLTFELYRNGTFQIDGKSGHAWQKSPSYRDSAFIRSTQKLPKTYKISIVVGEIDYPLNAIQKLPKDPEYPEGPANENGSYLLAITDEKPEGHHTNIWWHQHRKLVIDVDNNVWGHGMPNPIFMVYFDRSNRLFSFDGQSETWLTDWRKAVSYDPRAWYKVEIEKTKSHFILSIYDRKGSLLKRGKVKLKDVWSEDGFHSDYFVVGDPHENYYQGSMKIDSIAFTPNNQN